MTTDNLNDKKRVHLAKNYYEIDVKAFYEKDVKDYLKKFHNDYWKQSVFGDKHKKYISCDELDYLLDKHFGKLIKIETLQKLENQ